MTYAIATIYTPNYQDLGDLTDAPKQEYCERYGYKFFVLKEAKYSPVMGFNKVHYCLDLLTQHPEIEWLLFSECDATITNLTIPIEEKINNEYHFIIPVDVNNINAGNFLVRNTPEGRAYLQMIIDKEPEYATHEWAEQQVIIDTVADHTDTVLVVYQRYMNSYEPYAYDYADVRKDLFGNSGAWEPGDWIVHWPGLYKDHRIVLATEMAKRIVR